MTPEGKVKALVNKAFKNFPYTWKFMPVQMGMGIPALDYLFCINGRFVAIETKVPGKHLTPRQEQTAAAIRAAGGLVYVVYDDDSLICAIANLAFHCKFAP